MLFKFKSKASGDLILLEANGREILRIIGKEAATQGIILPEAMPAAVAALNAAVAEEAALHASQKQANLSEAALDGEASAYEAGRVLRVHLAQRAKPFIDMLQRAQRAQVEVVWGV